PSRTAAAATGSRAAPRPARPRSAPACAATRSPRGAHRRRTLAEAPLTAGEEGQRLLEVGGREVRPQALGEIELGVRQLPEKKIADAVLATGTDVEGGVGEPRERQCPGKARLGDLLRAHGPARTLSRK